ncbi:MAG: selenoneine biosynthesis selenosugar synthase SenB [Pseudomonadota bacterium]|nr:selenoneine biosynthesis selenosugar synthase SenB [Pseudomonadota bacterium]
MRIALITPYLPVARNGNAHTAARWDRFLRQAGHDVTLALAWDEQPADLMIALHARRSHAAVARFSALYPERPLILVLTGTDIYRDIRRDADAQASLALADCIVTLQEQGPLELPEAFRPKARAIYQSSPRLKPAKRPLRSFDVCVVAHLRDEKDPFRAAFAARLLPAESRIRVLHVGGPLEAGMAEQAERLAAEIPRWRWLGALAHGETRRRIARSHLLVLSSRMEGGANVICEAVMAATPVLASRIPGNVGMLGVDYAGYFPLGDESALAELMARAETDAAFYRSLTEQCAARAPLFEPAREAAAVQALARECR